MNRAVFLDRDGVINKKSPEGGYVTTWKDMHFPAGVAEAIRSLNRAAFLVIVVSNQRCVAKGLLKVRDLESIHEMMRQRLASEGATIDAIYFCPHECEPPCGCRKPAPGMLLEAAQDFQIDLASSWMIGDSPTDVAAGRKAGCKTARILSGEENTACADLVGRSLPEMVEQILHVEKAKIGPMNVKENEKSED
jgi:histidinol-phosphate phosphatase family protein